MSPRLPEPNPLSAEDVGRRLAPLCRTHGITRLEIFGSAGRGEARRDSDVDLVATFARPLGWEFFALDGKMSEVLGVPVHLLSRQQLDSMTNPFFKASILTDLRVIYDVRHEAA